MNNIRKLTIVLLIFPLLFVTITPINAMSNFNTITIDGVTYEIAKEKQGNNKIVTVTSDSGETITSIYSLDTGKLIIDEEEIPQQTPTISRAHAHEGGGGMSSYVLSRKTYVIPSWATTSVSALISIATLLSPTTAGKVIRAISNGGLSGKTISMVVTKHKSIGKVSSGRYKGKYQYWTNVKCYYNSNNFLNENHSFYYK